MESIGLIGKKIGMSREFFPIGISVPVTIIKIEKGRVIDLITKDKRGYEAIRVGFGKIKLSKLTKSMKGFYSKKNTEPKKYLKEYRVENVSNYKEGNEIGLEIFKDAKFVDVTSKTIGKGFAGVMKKYNFSGLRASHGVSVSHRSGGSTGQRQDPGKVFKGKKMPGHMGDKSRTILNLQVIRSDLNNDLIYLRGSIPGSKNTLVFIRNSVKKINKKTILEKNKITNKRDKISEEIDASKKSIITKAVEKKESTLKTNVKMDQKNNKK